MVGHNNSRYPKPCDYMIEQKDGGSFFSVVKCRHRPDPFCEIINGYDDITVPLTEKGLHVIKSIPHLVNGPTEMTG